MGSTWYFFFGSRRCAIYNKWVVKGETWRIQGTICGRDAFESLQVSSGIRERKFGECFNCSHYCFQCWGTSLKPYANHRTHWSCSEVGDWIGSGTSHIGVYNSEGTLNSATYLFEPPFPNEWPEVAIFLVTLCLPHLELVPASKVSPKKLCHSRLYRNFRSFIWKRRIKEVCRTVQSPLWVVHSNVQRAASNPTPHFAARSVGSVGCIRFEACPSTLDTIMWVVKTLSKFLSPHSWRDLQGFECIPATILPLNYSGLSLKNPRVVKPEGTLDSTPSLLEPPFLNKWPAVAIQAAATSCFWWHFASRNQVQLWQQVCRGICHNVWMVACVYHV